MLLTTNKPEEFLKIIPLSVSQSTALEESDLIFARQVCSKKQVEAGEKSVVENDGTNCCSFLCIAICNGFLTNNIPLQWDELKSASEDIITGLPLLVNKLRIHEELRLFSAYPNHRNANVVRECKLSEEFVGGTSVFSAAGRQNLVNALAVKSETSSKAIGVYKCPPYTFTIGIRKEVLFLLDTHLTSDSLDGNGGGILLLTEDLSIKS